MPSRSEGPWSFASGARGCIRHATSRPGSAQSSRPSPCAFDRATGAAASQLPRQFPKPAPHAIRLNVRKTLSVRPGSAVVATDPPPSFAEKVLAPHLVDQRVETPVGFFLIPAVMVQNPWPIFWSRLRRCAPAEIRVCSRLRSIDRGYRRSFGRHGVLTTDRASRVATIPLFHACRRHYPGGTGRCSRRSLPGRWQPSPRYGRVGFRIARFEACSAFTSRCGPHGRQAAQAACSFGVLQAMSLPP